MLVLPCDDLLILCFSGRGFLLSRTEISYFF